ncbi:MAG TPA: hypothetical protein VH164_00310 [Ktedonobacteraceae bacterium]|nr:hypothetical protein [Ktedonobacteraceae bacterium]
MSRRLGITALMLWSVANSWGHLPWWSFGITALGLGAVVVMEWVWPDR